MGDLKGKRSALWVAVAFVQAALPALAFSLAAAMRSGGRIRMTPLAGDWDDNDTDTIGLGAIRHLVAMAVGVALLVLSLTMALPAQARISNPEVDAYRESNGVSERVATRRLENQIKVGKANVGERLEKRLGGRYAGIWFDNQTGEYVVGLTQGGGGNSQGIVSNEFSQVSLTSDEYRTTTVNDSWSKLLDAGDRLSNQLRGLIARGKVKIGVDPIDNAVTVGVRQDAGANLEAAIKRQAGSVGVDVRVEKTDGRSFEKSYATCTDFGVWEKSCGQPMRGGVGIREAGLSGTYKVHFCSSAFRALGKSDGKRYFLTAGHCVKELPEDEEQPLESVIWNWETWDPVTGTAQPIGTLNKWYFPYHDWAKIDVTNTWADTAPWNSVAYWGRGEQGGVVNEEYAINGAIESAPGEQVCHSGTATGTTCGTVTELEKSFNPNPYGPEGTIVDTWLVENRPNTHASDDLCLEGGDSGGAVFRGHYAAGIVSFGTHWYCDSETAMNYVKINEAIADLDLSLTPAAIPSQTTISAQPLSCPPESVRVSGSVTAQGQNVKSGQVTVKFSKLESGQWVEKKTAQTGVSNGAYEADASLGAGSWRAVAHLTYSDFAEPSQSGTAEFTISTGAQSTGISLDENDPSPGPRAASQCSGTVDTFYRDTSGNLGHQWWTVANGWGTETRSTSIAPDATPRVVAQPSGNGNVDVFYRDVNGDLGHHWWNPSIGWASETRGASMASDPDVVAHENGVVDVFWRDVNGNLGHQWWTPGNGWFSDTRSASMSSRPQAVTQENGVVDVFWRDVNGNLGHQWWVPSNGWFSDTRSASIAASSTPQVTAQNNGVIDVFYRDTNGNLGHHWWAPENGWFEATRSASLASDPHVAAQPSGNGNVDVFFREPNGNLGHHWWNPSIGWASEIRSASMASDPHVVEQANGVVDVFYRDTNGNLGHHWWTPGNNWAEEIRSASIAARPPKVVADPASGVGEQSATLKGSVNPEAAPTSYYFEYGKTTSYGSKKPTSPSGVGFGTGDIYVSQTLNDLAAGATYHYRLVATSPEGTTYSQDKTFETNSVIPGRLAEMPIVEPFDGSSESQASFGEDFSKLGWAVGKGQDVSKGWGPITGFATGPDGIYHEASLSDGGSGLATVATLSASPGLLDRYFSLWLDMSSPGETKNGYELRFTYKSFNTYDVELAKWQGGAKSVLASQSGYSFALGSSVALVDEGGTVSAWTDTGSGFAKRWSASDAAFDEGKAGLEGGGNYTRLKDLKAGPLDQTADRLAAMPTSEPFDGGSQSLARFDSNWGTLGWASGSSAKGSDTSAGWRPVNSFSTINGAYYNASLTDSGAGSAAVATMADDPGLTERYFSLWLDMPTPGSTRAGYELRFTDTGAHYEARLSKWVGGSETVLASEANQPLGLGDSVAIVDRVGTVSAWVDAGSGFAKLLEAADSTYSSGNAGLHGAGNYTRLSDFKAGSLNPSSTPEAGTDTEWRLRNSNSAGNPSTSFLYGTSGKKEVTGDWDGDGTDTIGTYDSSSGVWKLRNAPGTGSAEITLQYGGGPWATPVPGDWNGDGIDTIGVYDPAGGNWALRNSNLPGNPDISFQYGGSESKPVVGNWDGIGADGIGVYYPGPGIWDLRQGVSGGNPDIAFQYGGSQYQPVTGDWDGNGTDTIGLYETSPGKWNLRNSNSSGNPNISFGYGGGIWTGGVTGDWDGNGTDTIGVVDD